jgi:hypothetical protein
MGVPYGHDFTESLDAVARGVRALHAVPDPELRDALAVALGLPAARPVLDPARRARMRRRVLEAVPPGPRPSDRALAVFQVLGAPAPHLVRAFAVGALVAGALAGAAVTSADSMPDEPLYGVKLTAEHVRLSLAVAPADRAAVELSLAEHRLAEAERLASDGRESGALAAASAYGAHVATAAAEVAHADEAAAPRATALVGQLESRVAAQRLRAAEAAERLAADPRTALAGLVMRTLATTPDGAGASAATRIAESGAAMTAQLSVVADRRIAAATRATAAATAGSARPDASAALTAKAAVARAQAAVEKARLASRSKGAPAAAGRAR